MRSGSKIAPVRVDDVLPMLQCPTNGPRVCAITVIDLLRGKVLQSLRSKCIVIIPTDHGR